MAALSASVRRRLAEAARLGMTDAILPRSDAGDLPDVGMRVHAVDNVTQALRRTPWDRADLERPAASSGPRALTVVGQA